jgi:hypothetical protein
LRELLLRLELSLEADLDLQLLKLRFDFRADVGALLLIDRCRRVSCISAIILFIRRFLRLLSVASIIEVAIFSRF